MSPASSPYNFCEWLTVDFPSFPRLPGRGRGHHTCNGTRRPIMMTMIRNQPMESGYFFPKVPNRYIQLLRQISAWIGYILLILAFAILYPIFCLVIAVIACPFCIRRGYREELIGAFFDAAGVPRLLLAKYRRSFKQREQEWDYEMGKPIPVCPERRRRLSQTQPKVGLQTSSPFLTKLPAELRLQVYKYVILEDSVHVHIAVHRTKQPGARRTYSRIHGHLCAHPPSQVPVNECRCSGPPYIRLVQKPHSRLPLPENCGRGTLALSKTCTQIYKETIDLLYSE